MKRLAEQIIRGQSRDESAEALLRDASRSHRERLGPDGARLLARLVAAYFRWLRNTKGAKPEERLQQAIDLDDRFRDNPASIGDAECSKAVPEWVSEVVAAPPGWHRALQKRAPLWLRARPGIAGKVRAALEDCRAPFKAVPDALIFESERDIFRTDSFLEGDCEVQDLSSHLTSLACAPNPGSTWWDACAGEGGKTMHLADLMSNKGLIWASDKAAWRLDKLQKRAARLKRFNIRTVPWAGGAQPPTRTKFDGVLVDAPCSGLGTWHRDPWARWTTTQADILELAELQTHLLHIAAGSVKPGGRLVFAVCTVTRPETLGVVEAFEAAHPEFKAAPLGLPKVTGVCPDPSATRLQIWQGDVPCNGMFIAAWTRA